MNDMDFILDDDQSFEGLFGEELAGYGSGDALDACRFLALTTTLTDDETEEAALELQTRGISLDISGLPRGGASGQMAARQDLEAALLKRGELPGKLEATDPLRLLLEDISRQEKISPAQADSLYDEQGVNALPVLTAGYLWKVAQIATEFMGYGVLLADLIQEGSLGLWQVRPGAEAFSKAADQSIRQALARAVTLQARAAGLGQELVAAMEEFKQTDRRLLSQLGRNPTNEDLSDAMGMDMEQIALLRKMVTEVETLKQAHPEPQEPDPQADQAIEDTAYFNLRTQVEELLSELDETDRQILQLRFGLNGGAALDVTQTAQTLGLKVDQVMEREFNALSKLREKR